MPGNNNNDRFSFTYYRRAAWWSRIDVLPFLFLYGTLASVAVRVGIKDVASNDPLRLVAAFGVTALCQLLLHLGTHWSIRVRTFVAFWQVPFVKFSTHIHVVPQPKKGTSEGEGSLQAALEVHKRARPSLSPVAASAVAGARAGTAPAHYSISHFKEKLVYDEQLKSFAPLDFPIKQRLTQYLACRGLTFSEADAARAKFGANKFDIEVPTISELIKDEITSPFSVFQFFSVTLWMLDEYWQSSLFTLLLLLLLQYQMAHRRQRDHRELLTVRTSPRSVWVFRDGDWVSLMTDALLPGDLFSLTSSSDSSRAQCPCDALLLRGNVVVDESTLTGEAVPQMKVPLASFIDDGEELEQGCLDVEGDHRSCVVFAGTSAVAHSAVDKEQDLSPMLSHVPPPPDKGSVAFSLCTGFDTTQGKLVRAIMYASERMTVSSREAIVFLLGLLACAVVAAGYVLHHRWSQPNKSKWKLILTSAIIVTSVVPPEFPLTMSLAVTLSLLFLFRKKIYCTEPFRVPYAGKANVCAFDKTGTLTSEKMEVVDILDESHPSVSRGAGTKPEAAYSDKARWLTPQPEAPRSKKQQAAAHAVFPRPLSFQQTAVLAACSSLSLVDGQLVGDPMEAAAIHAVNWRIKPNGEAVSDGPKPETLKVFRRFPFQPALQRMTVVARHEGRGVGHLQTTAGEAIPEAPRAIVLMKGSPEVLRGFLRSAPETYRTMHREATLQGYRVLALASKWMMPEEVRHCSRQEAEADLTFAGFLLLGCPVKASTIATISVLRISGHRSIMVTGDNALTACQVAADVSIVDPASPMYLLGRDEDDRLEWRTRDEKEAHSVFMGPDSRQLRPMPNCALCISGTELELLKGQMSTVDEFAQFVQGASVFARMSPQQKEQIIDAFSHGGRNICVMCGDGTNDVGALKAAHVGISLLGNLPSPGKPRAPLPPTSPQPQSLAAVRNEMIKAMEQEGEAPMVKLGEASVASSFTYRGDTIKCVASIIRCGRATLATMMTMYKLLAVNSLITAFVISFLALEGVKLGDRQTTIENVYVTVLFFAATRATPARTLSRDRPAHSVTDTAVVLSVVFQSALHIVTLVLSLALARRHQAAEVVVDLDGEFAPNIVNTVMFIVWSSLHAASFLANYEGAPFAQPMSQNKVLYRGILSFLICLALVVSEVTPELNALLGLVPLQPPAVAAVDPWLRLKLVGVIASDLLLSTAVGKVSFQWSIRRATRASPNLQAAVPHGDVAADIDDEDVCDAPSPLARLRKHIQLVREMKAAARRHEQATVEQRADEAKKRR